VEVVESWTVMADVKETKTDKKADILQDVEDFLLEDDKMSDFDKFADQTCANLKGAQTAEAPTTVSSYKDFCKLFQARTEKFAKAHSRMPDAFYKACRDARPKASESQQFAIDLILATTSIKDYAKLLSDEVKRRGS